MRDFIQIFPPLRRGLFHPLHAGICQLPFCRSRWVPPTYMPLNGRNLLKTSYPTTIMSPFQSLCPPHNEAVTIEATVRSLLALDYKLYEIIGVDDGSTDETAQVMKDAFHMWSVDRPIQRRIPCQPEEKIHETRAWKVPMYPGAEENGGKAATP